MSFHEDADALKPKSNDNLIGRKLTVSMLKNAELDAALHSTSGKTLHIERLGAVPAKRQLPYHVQGPQAAIAGGKSIQQDMSMVVWFP